MNDQQNTVVATTVCGLILVLVFLCPWRIESTGELKWSPIYQQPMSYVRTFDTDLGSQGGYSIKTEQGRIAFGIMGLEVAALLFVGGALYVFLGDPDEPVVPVDEPSEMSSTNSKSENSDSNS